MKTNIFHYLGFTALLFAAVGCTTDGDKFEYNDAANNAFFSGTETTPVIKFVVEDTPSTEVLSISTTKPVDHDVNVTLAIDPAAVDAYNAAHNTSYVCVPTGSAELESSTVKIPAGKAYSDAIVVRMLSTEEFQDGPTYVVPVTIKEIGMGVIESSRTIFLQVARVLHFTALDLSNPSMYSNFFFADGLKKNMPVFTYEVKCYSKEWHRIARLCSFTSINEQKSSMLRFGENGTDINSLQWVNPGGNLVSSTRFDTNRWYMITLVSDGSNLVMYVDGEKDSEMPWSGDVDFQRIELGMSWAGYPRSQYFNGYMAEMRVWEKALSAGEIKLGLCGVAPDSEGLVAYWKFNEGSGHIFHDKTGHGYDMDWSNTARCLDESSAETQGLDYSAYVQWSTDENNKCAE